MRSGILALALCTGAMAATYEIGPGRALQSIGAAPWTTLQPGDIVLIHWRPEPYKEKWVIARTGTMNAPLIIRGVPGPQGQLPVIDGAGAVTPRNLDFWNQERGVIKVGGSSVPREDSPASYPSYVVIENLEVKGARAPTQFLSTTGGQAGYEFNAAGIYIERGRNITIRGCWLHDNGNGLFIGSDRVNPTTDILIERNRVDSNGYGGRNPEQHNTYTEAARITYQYNYFGPLTRESEGSNLKDRSAGTVVRYNWIEGGNRQLDLVEAGSDAIMRDPRYNEAFVYGNVLIDHAGPDNSQLINYGGDLRDTDRYRGGTIFLYNNTIVSYRTDIADMIRLGVRRATADVRNNIYFVPEARERVSILQNDGIVDLRNNWFQAGFRPGSTDNAPGIVRDIAGNMTGVDPGFIDPSQSDYRLSPSSPCVNAGTEEASGAASLHRLAEQYVKHMAAKARPRTSALDVGAFESDVRLLWRIPSLTNPGSFPPLPLPGTP